MATENPEVSYSAYNDGVSGETAEMREWKGAGTLEALEGTRPRRRPQMSEETQQERRTGDLFSRSSSFAADAVNAVVGEAACVGTRAEERDSGKDADDGGGAKERRNANQAENARPIHRPGRLGR